MNKPAYLVDGDLEQKFIQNVCPGAAVQRINCNGDHTSLEAIAKRVGTLGRLLHKKWSPLIVVFDREGRKEPALDIEKRFLELLSAENLQVPVMVGVADRNIETWILADIDQFLISSKATLENRAESFEGKCGKASIKFLLPRGTPYVETIDGVAWLKSARPNEMKKRSPSFARFATMLESLQCWWLQELHLQLKAN